ncbi:hypothetical protein NC651_026769 [Populus alba x Populus x berolinensis]|nr:hypothetical protein NC651_026769 [Populus alba x Populus x berolinensis]
MSRKDEQTDLPKSALKGTSPPPKRSLEGIKGSICCLDDGANGADKQHHKGAALKVNHQLHYLPDDTQNGGTLRTERNEGQPNALPQESYQPGNDISMTKTNGQVNVAHENKKQSAPAADLIVLNDDEK